MRLRLRHALAGAVLAALIVATATSAAPTPQGLQGGIASSRDRERALQGSIRSDTIRIQGFQGRLDDLIHELAGIQASLDTERAELNRINGQLRDSRAHLAILRAELEQGMQALADQLVADYESPQPDVVSVIFSAHSFSDLLDRAESLKRIQDRNVQQIKTVKDKRVAVAQETRRLGDLSQRQRRITAATLVQRNQVASLKNAVLQHQLHYKRARSHKAATLGSIRSRRQALERRLNHLINASGGFAAHGGDYGFFPAPGTNYAVGDEPTLAAKLDRLGKALHLHLIGLSGYRTPQHSVEVGGFANDPHTRGQASDTPGVEGVSEATLNQFGLTRPFGGAAEADHIQLLGSAK
jgi:peptidoglycan hydrolase CwlO-like protein